MLLEKIFEMSVGDRDMEVAIINERISKLEYKGDILVGGVK